MRVHAIALRAVTLAWSGCAAGGDGNGQTGAGLPIDSGGGDITVDVADAGPSCSDGIKNGGESDVDCGGGLGSPCPPCADAKKCGSATDCLSGVCKDGICQPPSCTDGVKNGKETAVDCGGGDCPRCAVCIQCKADSDCDTTICSSAGLCAPTITVTKAVYAANCGAPTTVSTIVKACDKKVSCDYVFEYVKDIGYDPAYGCMKDLTVEYTCAGGTTTKKFYESCAPCDPKGTPTKIILGLDCPPCLGVGNPPK